MERWPCGWWPSFIKDSKWLKDESRLPGGWCSSRTQDPQVEAGDRHPVCSEQSEQSGRVSEFAGRELTWRKMWSIYGVRKKDILSLASILQWRCETGHQSHLKLQGDSSCHHIQVTFLWTHGNPKNDQLLLQRMSRLRVGLHPWPTI
jgi:hypothetical protein